MAKVGGSELSPDHGLLDNVLFICRKFQGWSKADVEAMDPLERAEIIGWVIGTEDAIAKRQETAVTMSKYH